MKLKHIKIDVNDDGTFQVECCSDNYGMGERKTYSAGSLKEVMSKIEDAQKEFATMKKDKKKDKVKAFLNTSDGDESDED
jgi:hypothetical protein